MNQFLSNGHFLIRWIFLLFLQSNFGEQSRFQVKADAKMSVASAEESRRKKQDLL